MQWKIKAKKKKNSDRLNAQNFHMDMDIVSFPSKIESILKSKTSTASILTRTDWNEGSSVDLLSCGT